MRQAVAKAAALERHPLTLRYWSEARRLVSRNDNGIRRYSL